MKKIKILTSMFAVMNMLNSNALAYSSDDITDFMENNDTVTTLLGLVTIVIITMLIIKNRKKKKEKENKKKSENVKDLSIDDKEEILFENETEMGKEEKKIFNKFMLLKYNVFNFLSIFFNPLLLFVLAICGLVIWFFIWLIWEFIKEGALVGALVMFAVITFGVIKSKKDNKKKKDLLEDIVFKYEFYDEYIVIHTNNTSNTVTSTDKLYFKEIVLKDICKYRGYIFLTQSRKSSWFINENNFTIGNKEAFEKYIQNKFNKKLKCYH